MVTASEPAELAERLRWIGGDSEILYLISVGLREADVSEFTRRRVAAWLAAELTESARALVSLEGSVVDRLVSIPGGREPARRGQRGG